MLGGKLAHHAAFVERAEPLLASEIGDRAEAGLRAMHLWLGLHAVGMLLAHDPSLVRRGDDDLLTAHVELLIRGAGGLGAAVNDSATTG